MKKLISLLSIVVLVAALATFAFASEEPALVVDTVEAVSGDEVVVNVAIVNNPGITVGELAIEYDATALELVPGSMVQVGGTGWNWTAVVNEANGMFLFTANNAALTGDATLLTMTFKVKEGVTPGTYAVKAVVDYIGDDDADLIYGVTFEGGVTVACNNHVAGDVVIENVVEATCATEGSHDEVTYCTICGAEMSRKNVVDAKLAHTPAEAVVENEVEATCQAEGSYDEVVYCSACTEELSRETKTVAKLAHTPAEAVKENEVAGTCLVKGSYEEVVYCSVCNEELSRTKVETELGDHVAGEAKKENVENADCQTKGSYDLVVRCEVCDEVLSTEHVEGEYGDHVPGEVVIENEVPAVDCVTPATYEEVVYCTLCGEELSREAKTGAAGDHSVAYKDNEDGNTHTVYCELCNEVLDPKEAHTYGEKVEDVENPGWTYKVCDRCGYIHREEPGQTGDNTMIAVAVATLSMMGVALVVSKKKEF